MPVAKKTISLPGEMYEQALERAKKMGYDSFSEYIQYLVQKDLADRPPHSLVRVEKGRESLGYGGSSLRAADAPHHPER